MNEVSSPQARNRITVTVSSTMRIALEHLASRNNIGVSTQATMILRQGLDRTISSKEVQEAVGRHKRARNTAEWQYDQTTEYAIEREYAHTQDRAKDDTSEQH